LSYFENGYEVFHSKEILNKINDINGLLGELLGLDSSSEDFFHRVHEELQEKFIDIDSYTGFLKALTNSPLVQSITNSSDLLNWVANCGVKRPTLVTPPILHVVSESLIINREKVFTPPHQDVISTKGSISQVVIWIPLHDVHPNNFGIKAFSGTHKLGTLATDPSPFGHTVKPEYYSGMDSTYLTLEKGDSVIFSQYLIHKTHPVGEFRMALSFRFNDIEDDAWRQRKYFVPFERVPITASYDDDRDQAPVETKRFFDKQS
jgi:hypothetical protein